MLKLTLPQAEKVPPTIPRLGAPKLPTMLVPCLPAGSAGFVAIGQRCNSSLRPMFSRSVCIQGSGVAKPLNFCRGQSPSLLSVYIVKIALHCFRLERQITDLACCLTLWSVGRSRAINKTMTAITTKISTSVKALDLDMVVFPFQEDSSKPMVLASKGYSPASESSLHKYTDEYHIIQSIKRPTAFLDPGLRIDYIMQL